MQKFLSSTLPQLHTGIRDFIALQKSRKITDALLNCALLCSSLEALCVGCNSTTDDKLVCWQGAPSSGWFHKCEKSGHICFNLHIMLYDSGSETL